MRSKGKRRGKVDLCAIRRYKEAVPSIRERLKKMVWEYQSITVGTKGIFFGGKVDTRELDEILNEKGAHGWELVNTAATHFGQGGTRDLILIFKRARVTAVMRSPS